MVYGDGDALPGVVVDRFGEVLVLQLTTLGAMQNREALVNALVEAVQPQGILLRNDAANSSEGLEPVTETVYGKVPEVARIKENNLEFSAPLWQGQKTGWFYDHRESRAQLMRLVSGARVLDLYCYLGAWGLQALQAGAKSTTFVDRSALALEHLQATAKEQGVADKVTVHRGEVDAVIKALQAEGEHFDIVVLDPPAFIKRRKDQRAGEQAYHRINQQAAKLLAPGGLLVSASCSLHMEREQLRNVVRLAASKQQRQADIVYSGGLGMDHPVVAAIPEMNYLKTFFARVS